ncbi:hypothetical protein DEO72_LG8g2111 [Vigna unguiculata]|uniref:Uncharacterized protein n=1 Tax=Vigna unguiculata TaxID=3917 RepID=A0A4D6MSM3_VIGUN|nr:hypothetical protein DEO72_LG8g2111 [Vigna unguiculata]
MLALVVDISAQPRAAHLRAMFYKCYDGSNFPHHKRMLALVVDISAQPRAAHLRAMFYKCYDGSNFPHHKIIQEPTDIQSQHCLTQHLAQAEGSRSGEFPLRLGEGTRTGA